VDYKELNLANGKEWKTRQVEIATPPGQDIQLCQLVKHIKEVIERWKDTESYFLG